MLEYRSLICGAKLVAVKILEHYWCASCGRRWSKEELESGLVVISVKREAVE